MVNQAEVSRNRDQALIDLLRRKDRSGMAEMYNRYFPKVHRLCYSYSRNRDDAFDLAQDVLLKVLEGIGSYEGKSQFSTWLYAITRNHCINQLNRQKKEIMVDLYLGEGEAAEEITGEGYQERENREAMELGLEFSLQLIPDSDRRMLDLKYQHNYSVKELQREFDISASAVKMRLLRARQRAERAMLEREVA